MKRDDVTLREVGGGGEIGQVEHVEQVEQVQLQVTEEAM